MKRLCKNCEWWEPYEGDKFGDCTHTVPHDPLNHVPGDDVWTVSPSAFCSNFFPPNPSCQECRWYVPDAEASMCYESPKEEITTSIGFCSRFQPNGWGE